MTPATGLAPRHDSVQHNDVLQDVAITSACKDVGRAGWGRGLGLRLMYIHA